MPQATSQLALRYPDFTLETFAYESFELARALNNSFEISMP